jgi:hypothetical protein
MRMKRLAGAFAALAIGVGMSVSLMSGASAAPSHVTAHPAKPPVAAWGSSVKPKLQPGDGHAAVAQASKGATQQLKLTLDGKPASHLATPKAGNNGNVDFVGNYNYCYDSAAYTEVYNYSASTQYYEVVLTNGSAPTRYLYSSIAAHSYGYPYWTGLHGTYYAYLYVWNGSSYAYDEYTTSNNTCNVGVSVSKYAYGPYVLLTIHNYGTDYVNYGTDELGPYSGYNTYTGGVHWDYPAPGGTAYRYYQVVAGSAYQIVGFAQGALQTPNIMTGVY